MEIFKYIIKKKQILTILIWQFLSDDSYLTILIWRILYDDSYLTILIWRFLSEDSYLKILIWRFLSDDSYMLILIWWFLFVSKYLTIFFNIVFNTLLTQKIWIIMIFEKNIFLTNYVINNNIIPCIIYTNIKFYL